MRSSISVTRAICLLTLSVSSLLAACQPAPQTAPTTAPASASPAAAKPADAKPAASPAASPAVPAAAAASPAASPAASAVSSSNPLPFTGSASGTVTVYTAGPAPLANDMKRDFEAATGAKLEVFQGNTGAVLARLDAERSRPQADVVILADWSAAVEMAGKGDLQAYTPAGADRVPAEFKDAAGMFISQGISASGIVYNTSQPAPKEWQDLTAAEWSGKITMPDPAQSGAAYDFLAALIQGRGEQAAWELLQGYRSNGLEVPGTNDAALAPIAAGAKRGVVAGVDYITYGRIKAGEPLGIVYPASGSPVSPRPMMILKSAPNVAGAKAFEDFMLSDAGQKLVAGTFMVPARQDVPADPSRTQLKDIKTMPVNYQRSIEQREATLSRFGREIAR